MLGRTIRVRRLGLVSLVLSTAAGAVAAFAAAIATPANAAAARSGSSKPLSIAYFASAAANGFSQAVWQGMNEEARKLGNVNLHLLDGNFSATTQLNQLQDAATTHQYNGAVMLLNDTVGSVPAVKALLQAGTVGSNVLSPEGPNLDSLKPQVPGLMNVISKPSYDTTIQANQVVQFCKTKNPCRVVIFIGGLEYPFDKVRYDSYMSVLRHHHNITVVALGQGNYDVNTSETDMSNILQAHPKFDVLLSGDQSTEGAQIALKAAGWNVKKLVADGRLFIDSLGADKKAVAAIREGLWNVGVPNFPLTAGELALKQVVDKLRGEKVDGQINLDKVGPVPLVLTKAVLKRYPRFTGQWVG